MQQLFVRVKDVYNCHEFNLHTPFSWICRSNIAKKIKNYELLNIFLSELYFLWIYPCLNMIYELRVMDFLNQLFYSFFQLFQ